MTLPTSEVLEREVELRQLRACVEAARDGTGHLVLVEGVAGIGKTSVLLQARAIAEEVGVDVLTARATQFERSFPFGVVRQLLEHTVASAAGNDRATLFAGPAADAEAVFTDSPVEPVDSGPMGGLLTTLNGLYWLTVNLAERSPLLLIVDDAQWSDLASRRFLRFLLPRLDGLNAAAVIAARPSEPGAGDDVIAELSDDPATVALHPAPLSRNAVRSLVRTRIALDAEDAFCDACHVASGGNPFLLGELLAELRGAGSTGSARTVGEIHRVAPESVRENIMRRIERLGPDALRLACAIAVLGDGVAPALVGPLAKLDHVAAGRIADALTAIDVLDSGFPWRFSHPLVRTAVYSSLAPSAAAAAHLDAARLLHRDGAPSERIALHLLEVDLTDDRHQTGTLVTAARHALGRRAPEIAVTYLRHALSAPLDEPTRQATRRLLVSAACSAIDPDALDDIGEDLDSALGLDRDPDLQLEVDLSVLVQFTSRRGAPLAVLDRAIRRADARDDIGHVLRLEAQYAFMAQQPPTASRARLAAYASRVRPGTPAHRLMLALESHWTTLLGESAAAAGDLARAALDEGAIFFESPHLPTPFQAVFALMLAEDLDGAERAVADARRAAQARGSFFDLLTATLYAARIAHLRGDVALAEAELHQVLGVWREMNADFGLIIVHSWLTETLIERGDAEVAGANLEQAQLDGALPTGYSATRLRFARGQLRLTQGRATEAIDDLFAIKRYTEASGEQNPAWMPWRSAVAPALLATGRADEADRLVEDELRLARRWGAPGPIGRALRVLASLDGGDRRLALLTESHDALSTSPLMLERLRTLCDLGTALRHSRRGVEARISLREALDQAHRLGAIAIAERAAEELAATGEKVAPPTVPSVASLTPSERRVASLASDGLNNREIAQTLFISVKTVETHLSAAYRKLDIDGRAALREAFAA